MLVCYWIHTIESFRQLGKQARAYLFEELRQREQKVTMGLVSYRNGPTPSFPKPMWRSEGYPIRRIVYSARLTQLYSIGFRPIWLLPADTGNDALCLKRAHCRGKQGPPFKPYLTPKIHAPPWVPDADGHISAQTQRERYAKSSKKDHPRSNLAYRAFSRISFVAYWQMTSVQLGPFLAAPGCSCPTFVSCLTSR